MNYLVEYNGYYLQSRSLCDWNFTSNKNNAVKFGSIDVINRQINELKKAKRIINRYDIKFDEIKIVENINTSTSDELQFHNIVKDITSNYDKLQNRKDILIKELSVVDKKQSDVLHYIEFKSLNACNGFKVYKLLKDIRLERRAIKQELDKITVVTRIFTSQIDNLENVVNNIDDRKYKPRILIELFEKGV